ncbi:unnamed protein product, partial [Rotaria magnacalcarata]
LIYKFNDLRLPTYIIKYLISFLESRTATVELDNTSSRLFTLSSGTPQGSPLSPLLFTIYTSDSMNGIPPHTEHGLFADDTALWTSSHQLTNLNNRLQQSINEFEKWCKHLSLKEVQNPVQVKVENIITQPATSTRYLVLLSVDNKIWDRIQIIQNKALRVALGLPHYTSVDYIHRIANIPRIKDYAVNLLERSTSTAASNNEMIYHRSLQDILQTSRTQQ